MIAGIRATISFLRYCESLDSKFTAACVIVPYGLFHNNYALMNLFQTSIIMCSMMVRLSLAAMMSQKLKTARPNNMISRDCHIITMHGQLVTYFL